MLNEVQIGNNIDYVASQLTSVNTVAGNRVLSGEPVVIGQLVGVAASSATLSTDLIDVQHKGVFNVPVTGNNGTTGTAVTLGAAVYIDPATGTINVNTGKVLFGYALAPVSSGATTVTPVKLKH